MSRLLKTIIIITIFLVAMVLITYLVPEVKEYAKGIAHDSKLPIWLVGLFAPILYLLKIVSDWFKGMFGPGTTEKEIAKENEAIKAEREKLLEEVRRLDEWRTRELALQRNEIAALEQKIADLRGEAANIDAQFAQLMVKAPETFTEKMSKEELQEQLIRVGQQLGISVSRGRITQD